MIHAGIDEEVGVEAEAVRFIELKLQKTERTEGESLWFSSRCGSMGEHNSQRNVIVQCDLPG